MKYKVSLLVLVGMLFAASSAFAAVQYYSLKNHHGEVIYQERPGNEFPSRPLTEEERLRVHIANEAWVKEMKPGEAAAIYVVPHNPNHELDIRSNPHQVNSLSAFRGMIHDPAITVPDELGGYAFQSASVHMTRKTDATPLTPEEKASMAEQLREQALAAGKEYAIMPLGFADTFWNAIGIYKKGGNEIALQLINLGKEGSLTQYLNDEIDAAKTKDKINGLEVVVSQWKGSSSITWVQETPEGNRYSCILSTRAGEVGLKELTDIAKSYIR